MAAINVMAANVIPTETSDIIQRTAGATITAGQAVYLDATDSNKAKLADADAEASAVVVGIALNGASSGQLINIKTAGNINPGGTTTVAEMYYLSATAGAIAPSSDALASSDYRTIIGVGTTASNLKLGILVSGVVVP